MARQRPLAYWRAQRGECLNVVAPRAASATGQDVVKQFFQAGIDASRGLLAGLNKHRKDIVASLKSYAGKATVTPVGSHELALPGQVGVGEYRVNVYAGQHELTGVDSTSLVEWNGRLWDITGPPVYHHSAARSTRHHTLVIRSRP